MSARSFSFPITRFWAATLTVFVLALVAAGSAQSAAPVDMGAAHDYSVLADSLTSNGPTAMSDNLGVWPGTTFAGDTAPIVLGEQHLGDAEADAAMAGLDAAYGDAILRPDAQPLPADLAGATLTPGVYNTGGAMGFTAGGVMTLDALGDRNAVFIFQIGAALTVGAGAQVELVGQADPCNVFWAVGAATSIGASAKLAGTIMSTTGAIGLGAGTRLDGRVLGGAVVTLSGNAIRTACSETIVVAGPMGPAGPAGADGVQGIQGETGPSGPSGADGADGAAGVTGPTGVAGADGATGAAGLAGPMGLTGLTGQAGLGGLPGAPAVDTTTLCMTKRADRRTVRRGDAVGWTIVVKNCGERAALDVAISDRLRRGAAFRARGGGTMVGAHLVWRAGTLAPGARRTYKTTTRFSRGARLGTYVNNATANGDNTGLAAGSGSITVRRAR